MSIWRPSMLVVPLLTTLPPLRLVSQVNTVKTLGMDLPENARAQLRNKNPDTHSNTSARIHRDLASINKMACLLFPIPTPTPQAAQIHRTVSKVITERGELCFM
eukprot:383729-Pelagomonas_calceolata.AAC.1